MTPEEIVRRYFEEFRNQGNVEVMETLFAPDALINGRPIDSAAVRRNAGEGRNAFELHITIDALISAGDVVVARTSARGTHIGEWLGIEPTGKQVTMWAIDIFRIAGCRIVEQWHRADRLEAVQQIGASWEG